MSGNGSPSSPTRVIRVLEVQGTSGYGGSVVHTAQVAAALHRDPHFAVHVVIRPGGPVPDELRAAGISVTELDLDNKFSLSAQQQLLAVAREFRPDIIHTHIRNADWHGGLVARRLGCCWISTIHDYVNFDSSGRRTAGLPALVYRRRLRAADALIAISHDIARDTAAQCGLPLSRFTVIHNGSALPVGSGDLRGELGIAPGEPVIGMLARLTTHKGADVLLAALALLPPELPWRALLVGNGPDAEALQAQAATLPPGRVIMLSARRDIGTVLCTCDVVAVPSRWEAFGRVITESMAAQRAVVASSTGGIPEIITDGDNGLLVPPADPAALAAALQRLLTDTELRARLARQGHARWQEQFTIERFQEKTLDALTSVV